MGGARIELGLALKNGELDLAELLEHATLFVWLRALGVSLNPAMENVQAGGCLPIVAGGCVDVLAPSKADLDELAKNWGKLSERLVMPDLRSRVLGFAMATLQTWKADDSKTNLSSIACRVRLPGSDADVVLTGDTTYDRVVKGLEDRGQGPDRGVVLQVPHHGSKRNTNTSVLRDTYFGGGKARLVEAFITGGQAPKRDGRARPSADVERYFGAITSKVTCVRDRMAETDTSTFTIDL